VSDRGFLSVTPDSKLEEISQRISLVISDAPNSQRRDI